MMLRAARLLLTCGVFVFAGLQAVPVAAQETRAAVIAAQQAEKAKHLEPYRPSRVEKVITDFRRRAFEAPGGFYPSFGSVYGGGGFTVGAGYHRLVGHTSFWDASGRYSIRSYKQVDFVTGSNQLDGHLQLRANVGWRDATQVAFYGIGMNSVRGERADYHFTQTYVGGSAAYRPEATPVVLAGGLTFEDYARAEPGGKRPAVEQVYLFGEIPGRDAAPSYLHTQATAGIDTRPAPGYAISGGYYGLTLHDYSDTDGRHGFRRLDVDLVQHIPIARDTWALSLRGRVQTTLDERDETPFFLLPSLGSGSTLRGYPSFRFVDRHSLLTTAEWRWFPNHLGFDMALFYDAGKVAPERGDLDFRRMKSDWGIGGRFHAPAQTVLRLDVARGSEGWNLVFAGEAAF